MTNKNLHSIKLRTIKQSIILEGLLLLFKIMAAILTSGMAIFADAVHSACDVLFILICWLKSALNKNKKLIKSEVTLNDFSIGVFLLSLALLYMGFIVAKQGIDNFYNPSFIKFPGLALLVSFIDAMILYAFGDHKIKIGKKHNFSNLITSGQENKTHLFSSALVFVGSIAAILDFPFIESLVVLAITVIIFQIGFVNLKNSFFILINENRHIVNKIKKKLKITFF